MAVLAAWLRSSLPDPFLLTQWQFFAQGELMIFSKHARLSASASALATILLAVCLAPATEQLSAQSSGNQPQRATTTDSSARNPANSTNSAKTKMNAGTTTVVVRGEMRDDSLPETFSLGALEGAELKTAPVAATVVTRQLLNDQAARLLSDVVKNDASIGEDYAPVGYYSDFQMRGFAVDLATGLAINGLTIAGEQDVPLENKQSVEFLKGLAGVENGVTSAGGAINFATKRPTLIRAVDAATDQRGTAYGAADLGRFFGSRKQVGARINFGAEQIRSYLDGADGWRGVGAAAADWKPTAKSLLLADFEYQHKIERSQSGYQLLGGTALPDLGRLYRSTMLGLQSWEKPNTFDVFSTSAKYSYDLPHNWRALMAASLSHSLIDDNVVYAYGCGYQSACQGSGGTAPDYFFAPDGSYDIYDYRNPGELRVNSVAEALVNGRIKTGPLLHEISAGGELFRRSVQMPTDSVYSYIGTENIYAPLQAFDGATDENGVRLQAGPRSLKENNHQAALLLQDHIHLPGHVQLHAAGRYDALRDHNYSGASSTDKKIWLPQFAATYTPAASLTLYANYGVQLSLGQQAPWWVVNGSEFLDPYLTRQTEVGAKFAPRDSLLITVALFRMKAPDFYPRTIAATDSYCTGAGVCFEPDGRETHTGIELNAAGKATRWLRLNASATAMNADGSNTSTASYNGKQILNQPHFRSAVFADVQVPHIAALHLLPGWNYTGRKQATRDNTISVNGYNIFNLGVRYTPGGENTHVSLRLYADNLGNKMYWKDTGSSGGDSFLYLGVPTTIRLAAHYTF